MDNRSTEDALKLDIPGDKIFGWLDDHKTLCISSDKPLNPWIVYRWSISEKALSREGSPLAKEFSGRFVTDLDREFLKVVRVIPLMPPEPFPAISPSFSGTFNGLWGSWTPSGPNMEQGPGFRHGIGVEFNKPPDIDSLRRAFSFVPSLPGMVELLSPVSAVFISARDLEPETVYSMRISGALKDREGLKMGDDYTTVFETDIPFLRILSFSTGGESAPGTWNPAREVYAAPGSGSLFRVSVNAGGIIQFVIHFSLLFDPANPMVREECAFRISLRPHFPATLPPVSLRTARWVSSDKLLMEWEGLVPSADPGIVNPGEAHYYKLLIPGGSGGVHNGRGSYLKEDFVLFLEAEE